MIVDCVMASYETDVLAVRDVELKDVVDLRVIVRGTKTFRGQPQIQLVLPTSTHTKTVLVNAHLPVEGSPWDMEHYLRDHSLVMGRHFARDPNDWFIVADADEIPHPKAVQRGEYSGRPTKLLTEYRQWWMDWKSPSNWQLERQATMGTAAMYDAVGGPSNARINSDWHYSSHVGWHLSTLGDAALASAKLSSFSHAEYDTDEHNRHDILVQRRLNRRDLLDRFDLEVTTDLPSCAEQFPHLLSRSHVAS